tara:strand:+ start:7286 stop:8188 length:903 start_codon:yes stop_codon:yes gene_type:complete
VQQTSIIRRIAYQPKKFAEAVNRQFTLPRYMNTRWITHGMMYERYHKRCQEVWQERGEPLSEAEIQNVSELEANGRSIVPPGARESELAGKIQKRFDELIADPSQRAVTTDPYRHMLNHSVEQIPEIRQILEGRFACMFERLFQSNFKIFEIETYRNLPNVQYQHQWMWHFDNDAYPVYKLIFYLTDTTVSNGPIAIHSKQSTIELFKDGFYNPYAPGDRLDMLNEPSRSVKVTGPAGTAVLFQNNCIHRATPPLEGFRDVVSFMVQPSMETWEQHFDRMGPKLCQVWRPVHQPVDPTLD